MELGGTRVGLVRKPLKGLDEVDEVREGSYTGSYFSKWERRRMMNCLPVRSLNSIAIDRMRSISGSEVESVRVANERLSMLLNPPVRYSNYQDCKGNLLQGVTAGVVGRIDGHLTVHRLFVHGPDHDPSLVVEDVVVSLDGLLSEQLSCDLTVLTPSVTTVSSIRMQSWGCDVPSLAIRRGSDRTTTEDGLVLDEVLLTA